MSAPADETDDVMDASPHQTQPEPQSEPLLPDAAPAARSRTLGTFTGTGPIPVITSRSGR